MLRSKDKHLASNPSRTHRYAKGTLGFLLDQWFLIMLGVLVAIASQYQVPLSQQAKKETVVTYLCVSLIFFITGCTLPTRTLVENYQRWKLHLFIQVQCFLMTSAITFGIVSAAASRGSSFMDPGLLVGLVFLGCLPTTISSNVVMTRAAHGNTALTVVQTTIGNFLGPFLAPALIKLYLSTDSWYTKVLPAEQGGFTEIYRRVFKQLGLSIYLPLVVGQVVQNVFPHSTKKLFVEWKLSKIQSFGLLIIVWQTFDQAFATRTFTSVPANNMIFVVFISIAFFLVWLAICFTTSILWLPKADTISVAYCVPAKSPATGVPLANVMFLGISASLQSKIQVPLVVFQGLQIMQSSLLITAFRHWIDKDATPDEEKTILEESTKPAQIRDPKEEEAV